MKIVIVYNRESESVINLFGMPNREKYGLKSIKRIGDALKASGHQVKALEGDKDLIRNLEDFMPKVLKNERPGMVFNLSYGIQGQARYTHVPGILEMVGIPYVGSGPLAHSLSLDKVVAKMIFRQNGLATPDFAVLDAPGFVAPDLSYPLIVKPKNESVSFGIKVVHNEAQLREAASVIFEKFQQPVLVEQYIEGREINVGILGNAPVETLPPAELCFGGDGPNIYTYEDKTRRSGREVGIRCPAELSAELSEKARELAKKAFLSLGCYDCARVDMRLDAKGNLYILEINSLPSLGEHGSYVEAARAAGLDFPGLVNRLVEVASARYFGTPTPPQIEGGKAEAGSQVFRYLTERRDRIEKSVKEWVSVNSRTSDPIGTSSAAEKLHECLTEIGLKRREDYTKERSAMLWESRRGFENGTLLIGHLDVPLSQDVPSLGFRREPEWLYGEGIGCSRAPLVELEYALRALRSARKLREIPLGVLYYFDEGRDCRYSSEILRQACEKAARVLVLRPGVENDAVVYQRRGQRKYLLRAEGRPRRLGGSSKKPDALLWFGRRLEEIARLNNRKERIGLTVTDVRTGTYPMHVPHAVTVTLLMSYLETAKADRAEAEVREIIRVGDFKGRLERVSDRPPMLDSRANRKLAADFEKTAGRWEIPFDKTSSVWPTVAGYASKARPVLCGIGPVARELYTPHESVSRISLVQRTLLLADFLSRPLDKKVSARRVK